MNTNEYYELIRPTDWLGKLQHFGNKGDGGYVVPIEPLNDVTLCYTFGVGGDISFEIDLPLHIECHLFDHTVNPPPLIRPHWKFHPMGLSGKTNHSMPADSFNMFQGRWFHSAEPTFLKMDCENGEYDYLLNNEVTGNVHMIVVEFHDVTKRPNDFKICLDKLKRDYTIVHMHLNNYSPYNVPELTLVNTHKYKQLLGQPTTKSYPMSGLDYANDSRPESWSIQYR